MHQTSAPLKGQSILVTGASSGIGRATAQFLAGQGARVFLNGRNREALSETAESMGQGQSVILPHELTDMDDAYAWMLGIVKEWGPLHGLVHSAGIRNVLPLRATKQSLIEREWRIHVQVPLGLIKGFRQRRPKALPGAIVLVSSVMGIVGAPLQMSYSSAKAAIGGLVRSAALELAPELIRINAVAPGCVETEMLATFKESLTDEQFTAIIASHPLGLGSAVDVAEAVAFLLGAKWITGTTLVVDGGYTAQ